MDSLITVYHHKYLRKSTSSVIFFDSYIFISILLAGKKLESVMIFMISTQIFLVTETSSLPQIPFAGGVGVYVDGTINYTVIERTSNEAFQALWIELQLAKQRNIICGVIYRQHHSAEGFFRLF